MIYKFVAKFRATGSVLDKKKTKKKKHILTEQKLDEIGAIGARLEASPKKSLC
jgi:transposase